METGYDMIPINPRPGLEEIRGLKVYPNLAAIDRPVDMVEVFRKPEDLNGIAGKRSPSAPGCCGGRSVWSIMTPPVLLRRLVSKVVMNRCPRSSCFVPSGAEIALGFDRRSA